MAPLKLNGTGFGAAYAAIQIKSFQGCPRDLFIPSLVIAWSESQQFKLGY